MIVKNIVILLIVSTALAEVPVKSDRTDFKKSLSRDCVNSYSLTCLKLDLVSWVEKLNEEDEYSVLPGVSVVRENSNGNSGSARANTADIVAELARDFPNDPDARLDAFLLKKTSDFLSSHSLKLNLWDKNDNVGQARGGEGGGGGGGGKKGGGMEMMLAAGAMMKATLAAIALKGLALIAGKALMTALISLVISAIIGLKSLTHGGHHSTTYEVVAKPVHTHEEHGHYDRYGRSYDIPPLPLGLQPGYKPPQ